MEKENKKEDYFMKGIGVFFGLIVLAIITFSTIDIYQKQGLIALLIPGVPLAMFLLAKPVGKLISRKL